MTMSVYGVVARNITPGSQGAFMKFVFEGACSNVRNPSPPRTYHLGTGALKGPLRTYYLGTWGAREGALQKEPGHRRAAQEAPTVPKRPIVDPSGPLKGPRRSPMVGVGSTQGPQCSSFLVRTYFLLRDYNILPQKGTTLEPLGKSLCNPANSITLPCINPKGAPTTPFQGAL